MDSGKRKPGRGGYQLFPDGFGQVEAERTAGADGDAHEDAEEFEHFQDVGRRFGGGGVGRGHGRVEDEAVAVGAGLVAAVGRQDQQRQAAVLQLLAHFGDALAVPAAAVVHALA